MSYAAWWTQQLAEFVAIASSFQSEAEAALGTVEHVAEALDAEIAAIVAGETIVCAVGFPEGAVPASELGAVVSGAKRTIAIPGVTCGNAFVEKLEYPQDGALVVARALDAALSREEVGVLHGIARVAATTMRMLHLLEQERERSALLGALVDEQVALRRVAWLVANAADQDAVLTAVAEEVCKLAGAGSVNVLRYDSGDAVRVASAGPLQMHIEVGRRYRLGGNNIMTLVHDSGRPARIEDPAEITGVPVPMWPELGITSVVGVPVIVHGQVWGCVIVIGTGPAPIPAEAEDRIAGFTELVATAIFNADARAELAASRARVVSASDATRRQIERDLHDGIQQRLVTLGLEIRGALDGARDWPADARRQLLATEDALDGLLEEVREIARGLHPALLSEAGLEPALRSLARRSPVPVELAVSVPERLAPSIEVAAYYVVAEALTNTAKHARAQSVHVGVRAHNGSLVVAIGDDGDGGADPRRGTGLIGLVDRVEALGGRLSISSPTAGGTSVVAELPTPGWRPASSVS